MSGALRRNAHEILEPSTSPFIKLKRALKDRSETQSEHIRRTTRDNREFDGSHTDSIWWRRDRAPRPHGRRTR